MKDRFGHAGMPTGPQGQKRPDDPVAAAVLRIATGESNEKAEAERVVHGMISEEEETSKISSQQIAALQSELPHEGQF